MEENIETAKKVEGKVEDLGVKEFRG